MIAIRVCAPYRYRNDYYQNKKQQRQREYMRSAFAVSIFYYTEELSFVK